MENEQNTNNHCNITVMKTMLKQLDYYKKEISELAYELLKREIEFLKNKDFINFSRQYGETTFKKIYFNLGPLIQTSILKCDSNIKFFSRTYTVSFEIKNNIIKRKIYSSIFNQPKNIEIDTICKDCKKAITSSISNRIKKENRNYEDIIPQIIESIKFIENEITYILFGCELSKY